MAFRVRQRHGQKDKSQADIFYDDFSISWEKAPADYSMLKLVTLPKVGGDTMFASAEVLYERLSPSFAAYLETLEAVHSGENFITEVKRNGGALYEGERGVRLVLHCRMIRQVPS